MRGVRSFVDTNVLVYFAQQESGRFTRAAEIVESGAIASVQVLNELANVVRSKFRRSWPEVAESLDLVRELVDVEPLTVATHDLGIALAERYNFHVYDAMIVAAALEAECNILYSEDMQHGLLVDGLTIHNPFRKR